MIKNGLYSLLFFSLRALSGEEYIQGWDAFFGRRCIRVAKT